MVNGGNSAFSKAIETVSILVTEVNDEQVLLTSTGMEVAENSLGDLIAQDVVNDRC